MMSIREAVLGRRAEALRALAASLVGGHLVVPDAPHRGMTGRLGTRQMRAKPWPSRCSTSPGTNQVSPDYMCSTAGLAPKTAAVKTIGAMPARAV